MFPTGSVTLHETTSELRAGPGHTVLTFRCSCDDVVAVVVQRTTEPWCTVTCPASRGCTVKFDPRAVTGIPTEPVGSLPRPQALLDAYAEHDAGRIDDDALGAAQDRAVRDTMAQYEATGAPIVSDGELGRTSFASYPVADATGTGVASAPDVDDPHSAIFTDGHGRLLRQLTGGPFRYRAYAADTLAGSTGSHDATDEAGRHRAVGAGAALPAR